MRNVRNVLSFSISITGGNVRTNKLGMRTTAE
jgi:hypothetical protein